MRIVYVRPAALLSLLLFMPALAAAVTINEIDYDLPGSDTDREWLEVYQESGCVNLTGWKFYEANTNHGLALVQGSEQLCDGGFAVIAEDSTGFLADHSGWSGTLFDSSFSLSNTGEALAIKDSEGNITDSVTYSGAWGAAGNGRTLERNSTGWYESLVNGTPGAANSLLSPPAPQQNDSQQQSNQSEQSSSSQSSGQQSGQQTSSSNLTTNVSSPASAPVTGNLLISLVDPPSEVEAGSAFALKVRVFNNFTVTKKLDVSSYAFSGQQLATEGGWKPNAFTLVIAPGEVRVVDLLNEIKPDASGTYHLRARAFDGNTTWDAEAPLQVIEPEPESDQIVQPADAAGNGPTGAFVVGNVDLVRAALGFLGGLWDWLTGVLPFI